MACKAAASAKADPFSRTGLSLPEERGPLKHEDADMRRILIIGSNGAGKSTFSYRLAGRTGLPLVHIDQIYWRKRWEVTPKAEFELAVLAEAEKPRWIIEGNNIGSLSQRLAHADTVFWFEFPPLRCAVNVVKRELEYRGRVRPDMPDQCVSRFSLGFIWHVLRFNRKNRRRIEDALKAAHQAKIIRFTNYRQVESFLESIS